jgi:hypothetical protein
LNQMRFCTVQPDASKLVGGGTACDNVCVGVADGQHPTWDAGRVG